MSVYTNDVDTLRQLLSQSIPQIINSVITMAATLVTMIILNPALTVISILTAAVMLLVTSNFSKIQVFLHLLDAHAAFLQAYKILDPLQIPVVEDAAVILITLDIWDQPLVAIVF